ncbi:4Fe-4S dicluster domain-containing protein [Desulfobacter latus]|uniref:4Fe-4S dicluster domain-containing protein n=1 Tax=Desulfobacter latus TaxID=2292 RepID=A0A850SW78_9BACT|nr:4Fe-4S dicluster domain-containing protein [Desulfobacter latus]NWH04350.1 4Fe-4S dicluster domain-containing protein [Desulfobacter latus]
MIKRSFFALSKPRLTYDLLDTSLPSAEELAIPGTLTLLLPEKIDRAKKALIGPGDAVKKGQKLKLYDDSAPYVLSPAAGTIKEFDSYADDFGSTATYITIKPDPSAKDDDQWAQTNLEQTLEFAADYLGHIPGALPVSTLTNPNYDIRTIVVTGADTDILCDTCQFVCTAYAGLMVAGAKILKAMTRADRMCITVPEKLSAQVNLDGFNVLKTSDTYPSNLPAMIMKDHFGKALSPGTLPEEEGVCFIRPEALVSLARTYETGHAVFDKIITLIDKGGQRHRVKATIGTPISKILSCFNVQINEQDRVIIGGPMRGFATYTVHHPVVPDMDTLMVQDSDVIPEISDNACVNCGECVRVCPANVPVNLLVRYLEANLYEEAADRFDLESCIECGLCGYVCRAGIPLYQYIRLGKHELLTLRENA